MAEEFNRSTMQEITKIPEEVLSNFNQPKTILDQFKVQAVSFYEKYRTEIIVRVTLRIIYVAERADLSC